MRLVLLGPPGAGKGTQAEILKQKLGKGALHLSVGDFLRQAVKKKTALGEKAEPYMSAGKLVPDDIILGVIKEALVEENFPHCFLMDGFPRTVVQAETFDKILKEIGRPLTAAIALDVPLAELVERLTKRRSCPVCQRIYHLQHQKPKHDALCDVDQTPLIRRDDDSKEIITKRFATYTKETVPALRYYEKKGILIQIGASAPIDEVSKDVEAKLNDLRKAPQK